jgi:glycosyltransferase involved in cell wall biosynthesis
MQSTVADAGPLDEPTRILLVHNRYKIPGGEDSTFESERDLLARMGHTVETLEFHNRDTDRLPRVKIAADAVWSVAAKSRIAHAIRSFSPHVVHFHNTFVRVSPAGYWACKAFHLPVVQTLHNYRFFCVNGLFLRDGRPCEDCLGKQIPWPGIAHRCYHASVLQSGVVASVRMTHECLGTYSAKVDAYIALTEFGKAKFVAGGLPESAIHVKPNFVDDIGVGGHRGQFCLFVGRLSTEKGIAILLDAWRLMNAGTRLVVVGAGPLESLLRDAPHGVEYAGPKRRDEVRALMRDATLAIVPSICYENFPLAIVEAFSVGLPVAASRLGAMEEILRDETAGWLFAPDDARSLAATIQQALSSPAQLASRGREARLQFERKFGPEANYRALRQIYAAAAASAHGLPTRTR